MTDLYEEAREAYTDQLRQMGFCDVNGGWEGSPLQYPGASIKPTIRIVLASGFPFAAPDVYIKEQELTAASWHLNVGQDGSNSLCLFGHESGYSDYPWADPLLLVDRIAEWMRNDSQGWPDDPPVQEIETYLPCGPDRLLFRQQHLDPGREDLVVDKLQRPGLWHAATRSTQQRADEGGQLPLLSVTLGNYERPIRSGAELHELMSRGDQERAAAAAARHGAFALLLSATHRGHTTHFAVHASSPLLKDALAFRRSLLLDGDNYSLRSGPAASAVSQRSVAVIGCGAIGSYVADALVRGGLRSLTLHDDDILLPGNCVRHLCGIAQVGLHKTSAVIETLRLRGYGKDLRVTGRGGLHTPADAMSAFMEHDLVIDATANATATGMLQEASRRTGRYLLSACVLGDGQFVRVDRWPLLDDEEHSTTPPLRPFEGPARYEDGCGDPVSPTPPFVSQTAAMLTARSALDILRNGHATLAATILADG